MGLVEQTETAALKKVSKTKNRLFARALTHLYTAATYVTLDDTGTFVPDGFMHHGIDMWNSWALWTKRTQ